MCIACIIIKVSNKGFNTHTYHTHTIIKQSVDPRAESEMLTKAEERKLPYRSPDLNAHLCSLLLAGGRQRRPDRNSEKGWCTF